MFTLPPPHSGLALVTRPQRAHSEGTTRPFPSPSLDIRTWGRPKTSPYNSGPWRWQVSSDPHPLLASVPMRPRQHRKPEAKRRSRRISVPVSPEEYEAISNMAEGHGCAITDVMRSPIKALPPPLAERPIILAVRRHLSVVQSFLAAIQRDPSIGAEAHKQAASVAEATNWLRQSLAGTREKGRPG